MKWRSWVSALFGVWFIIAPWVLGFSHDMNATWGSVIVGVVQLMVAIWQATRVDAPNWRTWQSWVGVLCGFWFVIHPFLGDFEEAEYYAIITPGILTICVNLWTLMAPTKSTRTTGRSRART